MSYEMKETENIEKLFISGKSIPSLNKIESSQFPEIKKDILFINEIEYEDKKSFPFKDASCNFSNEINEEQNFSKIIPAPNINLNIQFKEETHSNSNLNKINKNIYEEKMKNGQFQLIETSSPKIIDDTIVYKNKNLYLESYIFNKFKEDEMNSIVLKSEIIQKSKETLNKNSLNKKPNGNLNFDLNLRIYNNERPLQYSRKTVDLGKNFFKKRYINEKLNFSNIICDRLVNEDAYIQLDNSQNNGRIYNEDKLVIKYNTLFLKQLEKGIFSFNLMKYEDSYNFLVDNNVIKNIEEFGELLLVIHGFDKYIVGEFLSNEKPPNKAFIVLKSFMKKFCFIELKFLDAFRFLLSRLNLPRDSSMIVNILDQFSEVYYK